MSEAVHREIVIRTDHFCSEDLNTFGYFDFKLLNVFIFGLKNLSLNLFVQVLYVLQHQPEVNISNSYLLVRRS